ncbi:MAG: hypothetical protein M1338_00855, partial [Patescibacteria group bacterium]|nr:hypothetical protein [Patescibacteria group bacterium]
PRSNDDSLIQLYGEGRLLQETLIGEVNKILKKNGLYRKNYPDGFFGRIMNKIYSNIDKATGAGDYRYITMNMLEEGVDVSKELERLSVKTQTKIKRAVDEIMAVKNEMADLMRFATDPEMAILKKESPHNWQNVVKASEYFRGEYNKIIDEINSVRVKFGYKPIPYRKDYFRHFNEMSDLFDLEGLDRLISSENLSTSLAGETEFFRPGKPFNTAQLQRRGIKTKFSALAGMENYLDTVSKEIFHTETLQRIRALENYITNVDVQMGNTLKLQNFKVWLKNYGDKLAYKKEIIDRAVEQKFWNRGAHNILKYLDRSVSMNMILGNVRSAAVQILPFAQHLTYTNKKAVLSGLKEALSGPFLKETATQIDGLESKFLYRRFRNNQKLAPKWTDKGIELTSWLFQTMDKFTSKSTVAGKYYENRLLGMAKEEALEAADEYAIKLLADRSYGETPTLFDSKMIGQVTRFQLEVNNLYSSLLKDLPKIAKEQNKNYFLKLLEYSIYVHLFNDAFEVATGSRVEVDPIQYAMTIAGIDNPITGAKENRDFKTRLVSGTWEQAKRLPFTSLAEGRYPISAIIPKSMSPKDISTMLFYLSPVGGGGQVKKIYEGLTSYYEGEVRSRSGKTKNFGIEQNVPNFIRSVLFGKWSTPEARQFFNEQGMSTYDKAEIELKKFKNLSPEERNSRYQKIKKSDPNMADQIKKVLKDMSLGVTKEDREIRAMGITDGERAKFILNNLKKLKGDERNEYYSDLRKKGIITDDVKDQLIYLMKNQ